MDYLKKTFEKKPKECYIEVLPDEILLKIFKYLTTRWLCHSLLVSRHWRLVGEDPSLWRCYPLAIGSRNVKHLSQILRCSRFSQLEQLLLMSFDPYDCEDSKIDTAAILRSSVKKLEVRFVDMRINMRNACILLDHLIAVTIHCCPLDQKQADELFAILEKGVKLQELTIINPLVNGSEDNIAGDGLSKVTPDTFGRALANIFIVKLHEVCLTVPQLNTLMKCIDEGATLRSLDIYDSIHPKISESSSSLLASSFNCLESLTIHNACLGESRTRQFLETMAVQTNLNHLNLRSNSLRGIHTSTISEAFHSLTSLNIEDTDISTKQLESFFLMLKEKQTNKLLYLSLGHNDLSLVEPELFAGALRTVAKVNINATSITKDQAECLFQAILRKSALEELNLSTNDFSSVNTTLMAAAVNKLRKVFMFYTGLTEDQVEAILKIGLKETNLLHLDLRHNLSKNSPNKLTKYIRSHVDEILL